MINKGKNTRAKKYIVPKIIQATEMQKKNKKLFFSRI